MVPLSSRWWAMISPPSPPLPLVVQTSSGLIQPTWLKQHVLQKWHVKCLWVRQNGGTLLINPNVTLENWRSLTTPCHICLSVCRHQWREPMSLFACSKITNRQTKKVVERLKLCITCVCVYIWSNDNTSLRHSKIMPQYQQHTHTRTRTSVCLFTEIEQSAILLMPFHFDTWHFYSLDCDHPPCLSPLTF